MTTSNDIRDSHIDDDDVQSSPNIYVDDDNNHSWSLIKPYRGSNLKTLTWLVWYYDVLKVVFKVQRIINQGM